MHTNTHTTLLMNMLLIRTGGVPLNKARLVSFAFVPFSSTQKDCSLPPSLSTTTSFSFSFTFLPLLYGLRFCEKRRSSRQADGWLEGFEVVDYNHHSCERPIGLSLLVFSEVSFFLTISVSNKKLNIDRKKSNVQRRQELVPSALDFKPNPK